MTESGPNHRALAHGWGAGPEGWEAREATEKLQLGEAEAEQKSRSVVVPSCVAHRYATVEKGASLDVTMRRVAKAAEALAPTSALVFLSAASLRLGLPRPEVLLLRAVAAASAWLP